MARITRSPYWPLVAVLMALYVAHDLGAKQVIQPGQLISRVEPVSLQVDVSDAAGQIVLVVPPNRRFVLKDVVVANTMSNKFGLDVGKNVYPSIGTAQGVTKLAGTNLMEWSKGMPQGGLGGTPFGGGIDNSGSQVGNTQTGLTLTGGVVFEPGSRVVVHDYVGPLYFDGEMQLVP